MICTVSVSAQLVYSGHYIKCLDKNLHSLNLKDDIVKDYCKVEDNETKIHNSNNKITIGDEVYPIEDISMDYYEGFNTLSHVSQCRLQYAWAEVRATIFNISKSHRVPVELSYLPMVVSSFNKYYSNETTAYGFWGLQFIPAVRYGIVADANYDERLDVSKSTVAAMSYLNELHKSFGSWDYAITAYACGPAMVRKAMTVNTDFDSVVSSINSPDKYIFYSFLALVKWMNENEICHPLPDVKANEKFADTIVVVEKIHFEQIAGVLELDVQELLDLNPLFTGKVIDGRCRPKAIYLPLSYAEKYYLYKDSILHFNDSIYFPKYEIEISEEPVYSYGYNTNNVSVSPGDDFEEIKHSVVTGDNLGFIAEKYHVKVSDLQDWNNISGTTIYVGQIVSVWVKKGTVSNYTNKAPEEKKKESFTDIVKLPEPEKKAFNSKEYTLVETYVVKSGDSPYKIALDYSWATAEDIMLWNDISDPSKLQVGQKLKIYKKK